MQISDFNETLLGLSVTPSSFGLWTCPLNLINTDVEKANNNILQPQLRGKGLPTFAPGGGVQKSFLP